VLFVMPEFSSEVQDQLRDALLAQFTLVEAHIVLQPAPPLITQRAQQALAAATEQHAIAAFWIEEEAEGRWLVHLMDSAQQRIVVRSVDAQAERRGAAIEAVAVMVREATRALIEGVPVEAALPAAPAPTPSAPVSAAAPAPAPAPEPQTPTPTPTPPPSPAPPPPTPPASPPPLRPLRLSTAYSGNSFASQQVPWQSGIGFSASWLGFRPIYFGVSYLWTPPIVQNIAQAMTQDNNSFTFEVRRLPFAVFGGYRYAQGPLAFDGELGVLVDHLARSFPTDAMPQPRAQGSGSASASGPLHPLSARDPFLMALSPRLRGEVRPLPGVGLYLAGGLDILLNGFKYVYRDQNKDQNNMYAPLLEPNRVRPVAEVGIAFYP
jgi:hypothetical protein